MGVPSRPPQPPTRVAAAAASDTALKVSWAPPLDDGGVPVQSYKVEWDGRSGVVEQQAVTLLGAGSGTFRLAFNGATTAPVPHDATSRQLESALAALPTVGSSVQVTRLAEAGGSGFTWTVLFLDTVGDVALLEAPASARQLRAPALRDPPPSLTVREAVKGSAPSFDQGTVGIYTLPLGAADVSAANEVQTITVEAAAADTFSPLGGSFRVVFEGHTSVPIAPTASAAEVKTALEGILTVGAVSVTVEDLSMTSAPPNRLLPGSHARRWTVTFEDSTADVPSLLVSTGVASDEVSTMGTGGTLGGTAPAVYVETVTQGGPVTEMTTPAGGLAPGTQYFVRVSADNGVGTSAFATSPFAVTTAQQPPLPPQDVVVVRLSDTSLGVSWSAPKGDGGADVTRYSVMWSVDTSFDGDAGRVEVEADGADGAGRHSHVVSGLTDQKPYYVQVLSYNRIGYSVPAPAVPLGTTEEIQRLVLTSPNGATDPLFSATFTLAYTDHSTAVTATTPALRGLATATEVGDALGALTNCGPVRVTRYDHSTDPIGAGALAPFTVSATATAPFSRTATGIGPFAHAAFQATPVAATQTVKLTAVTNVAGGMGVGGSGVKAGTKVGGVNTGTSTITLDQKLDVPLTKFTLVTASSGTSPLGSTTLGLAAASADIAVGMTVEHASIPTGTTVAAYAPGGKSLYLSAATTGSVLPGASLVFRSTLTFGSPVVQPASLTNVAVGQAVTGPGIPPLTTVAGVDSTEVTLSAPITVDLADVVRSTVATTAGTGTFTLQLTDATGVEVGQTVTGTGIPTATTVTALSSDTSKTVTLSAATTAPLSSAALNFKPTLTFSETKVTLAGADVSKVEVGQAVEGSGVAPGTTIAQKHAGNQFTFDRGLTGALSSTPLTLTTTTVAYDSTAINTAVAKVEYVIRFVGGADRGVGGNLTPLQAVVTGGGAVTAAVSEVQQGLALGTASVAPARTVPSVPLAVNLTVISTSELGVYWAAPKHTGGSAVLKYLVEWDTGEANGASFSRSAALALGESGVDVALSKDS